MNKDDLKRWRRRVGDMTQQQAADLLGISIRQYSNYERGCSKIPAKIDAACGFHTLKAKQEAAQAAAAEFDA